ncbi:hypothetical protein AQUCO_02000595v1 [Aquilegia coerulea]|uniref:Pectinesterase n=1 Tax=Aquilegia coerulea TaxID=218851 RepID=A0A2G5DIB8_AQUCA|nr:hypothetical protein AQUCO_02000595v1 [Aquilegia coerulea]
MRLKRSFLLVLFVWIQRAVPSSWGLLDDLQHSVSDDQHVQKQCGFTRYPEQCIQTLLGLRLKHPHADIISAFVEKLRNQTMMLTSNPSYMFESLNSQHASASSVGYCVELMNMSHRRLDQSLLALKDSPRKRKKDIQTWLSSVLTFQSNCKDVLNGHSEDLPGILSRKMEYLSHLASNTLALVNRITGDSEPKNTTSRRLTSNEDFPQWVTAKTRKLLQTTSILANAVVAQDGSGNYLTVSAAIQAASGGGFVIYVKAGVYEEKIHTNKDGITLIGDGKYSTIIAYGSSVQGGSTMPGSATFAITGDRFIARDIGFQNIAGPKGGQALAMDIASDRSVLYRCSIVGYQDTLYAHALRQFYRECDIYGTVDFIFGNAAAVFQNCYLVLRRPQSGAYNVMLANGREDPGQNTGFSIQRCRIAAGSDLSPVKYSVESYLGRPWKKYSRSVIMQSIIDDAIRPRGWIEWSNNFALNTLYFAEYSNSGPGASTSNRVKWPGHHVIGPDEAAKFTVANFIDGTTWLPSTGIIFDSDIIN